MTNEENNTIRVIVCKPGKKAEAMDMEENLSTMQSIVGGLIQEYFPFHSESDDRYDSVVVVCNDEGKLMRLDPSRAIFDEKGDVQDVIAGPFFICYAPIESETFMSLPEDLEEEFLKKFEKPERYYRSENGIEVVKYDPRELQREYAR